MFSEPPRDTAFAYHHITKRFLEKQTQNRPDLEECKHEIFFSSLQNRYTSLKICKKTKTKIAKKKNQKKGQKENKLLSLCVVGRQCDFNDFLPRRHPFN